MSARRPGKMSVVVMLLACAVLEPAARAQIPRPAPKPKQPDTRIRRAPPLGNPTWVKTGLFNEIDQTRRSAVTVNEPTVLRFIWGTTASGANEGFWRLRRRIAPNQYALVATGVATSGTGGRFDVDLGPYLATTAPVDPAIYHLEVVARVRSSVDTSTSTSPGQGGVKIPAREIGAWSVPVVITYARTVAPPTTFNMGDVYRKATLVLDRIILIVDQNGPGQEEYHLGGFVQELQRSCTGSNGQQQCSFSTPLRQVPVRPVSPEPESARRGPARVDLRRAKPPAAEEGQERVRVRARLGDQRRLVRAAPRGHPLTHRRGRRHVNQRVAGRRRGPVSRGQIRRRVPGSARTTSRSS